MPRRAATVPTPDPIKEWLNKVPAGSLDQLQYASQQRSLAERGPNSTRTLPRLPSSSDGLVSGDGSSTDASSGQPSNVEASRGGRVTPETVVNQLSASSVTTQRTTSTELYALSIESLLQLQNAGTAAEVPASNLTASAAEVPLPAPQQRVSPELNVPDVHQQASSASYGVDSNQVDTDSNQATGTVSNVLDCGFGRNYRHQHPVGPSIPDYWRTIQPLVECLPRLKAIDPKRTRLDKKGTVTSVDYYHGWGQATVVRSVTRWKDNDALARSILQLKNIADPEIATRFVVVEDICRDLISCLGSIFEIDPEFFAEHLRQSGYSGMDYTDEATNLDPHIPSQAYACLKWYRPAHQNPQVTQWLQNPSSLVGWKRRIVGRRIQSVPSNIMWSEIQDGNRIVDHYVAAETNIFRRTWTLSTRPTTRLEDQQETRHLLRRTKRKSQPDAEAPEPSVEHRSEDSDKKPSGWRRESIPTAWEEKATLFRYDKAPVPIFIILLDPLPSIIDYSFNRDKKRRAEQQPEWFDAEDHSSIKIAFPMAQRIPLDYFPVNKYEATQESIAQFQHDTETIVGTAEAMDRWMPYLQTPNCDLFRADPVLAILLIMAGDSKGFLHSIESTLEYVKSVNIYDNRLIFYSEISEDSLDDYLMTRRLEDWRKFMSRFEIEIPALRSNLVSFVQFLFKDVIDSGQPDTHPQYTYAKAIVDDLDIHIDRLMDRLGKAYTALRADMQFTESRRSIREAQAVTKLTELAFIFIPLTFACSLFSMSIKELQHGVPVWTFVITAIGLALVSYAIRIVVTSDVLADSSRRALEKLSNRNDVRVGQSASIFTYVALVLKDVWSAELLVVIAGIFTAVFCVVPTGIMWKTTNLDLGFTVAVTIFLMLSSAVSAWITFAALGR